jgi:hypothetical protein
MSKGKDGYGRFLGREKDYLFLEGEVMRVQRGMS